MSDFKIYPKQFNTVLFVYGEQSEIVIDPDYQRASDIWPLEKRQLLIDSILNGFDLPKLYFHEYTPARRVGKQIKRYSIIDGKQRLESIWGFIDGKFQLSSDFEYVHDETTAARGMSYEDLARSYPKLKSQFDATSLPITIIQTEDSELIEDMFSRLNEAVPLNAPEKRNALGGPLPKFIRTIAQDNFFTQKLPYSNGRYRHFDLATKFLYLEYKNGISDTKKEYLDAFVRDFREKPTAEASKLANRVKKVLGRATQIFGSSDRLLGSAGMSVVYYLLLRDGMRDGWSDHLARNVLMDFEQARLKNRTVAEDDITKANYEYLEFDRLMQSPNHAIAMDFRVRVLRNYLHSRNRKVPRLVVVEQDQED